MSTLSTLQKETLSKISQAKSSSEMDEIKIEYFGRKGKINSLLGQMAKLSPQQKKEMGKQINQLKFKVISAIGFQDGKLKAQEILKKKNEWFDVTAPAIKPPLGHLHLITQTIREITTIFAKIGFVRVGYPEVDYDWYAFEDLNMPKNHPARDEWETFFVDLPAHKKYGDVVLTPHTSNGQVRGMERLGTPPIRMINIAKCFRRQSDVSHTPMFHQFEGMYIDRDVSVGHLKGFIDYFVRQFFGPDRKFRLRPFHFRFTEPSFEVDISCDICKGKGCRLCKDGWLELAGSGMIHPVVLKNGGINPNKYSGFAIGWGVERTSMMKSGVNIPDLRMLYTTDVRLLKQF